MIDRLMLVSPLVGLRAGMACCAAAVILILISSVVARADGEEAAWEALRRGGHFAIMRHATAPGTGDPPGFDPSDCDTQRNLSADGRAEAKRIGDAFRTNEVEVDGVYASQWCRCLETARVLDLGEVTELAALNSFFGAPERGDAQMAALWAWLVDHQPEGTQVLVTHQVVISALTGGWPRPGETVVFRVVGEKALEVVGRISPQ